MGALVRRGQLPKFSEVTKELKEKFWLEAELAEFSKALGAGHLRGIERAKALPLLERAVTITCEKLKSAEASEVVKALRALSSLVGLVRIAEQKEPLLNQLNKLTEDPDNEVSKLARKRLEEITAGKRV